MEKVINCRVPDELHSKLKQIANFEDRPVSYITRKAVIAYMEEWEKERGSEYLHSLIMGNALSNAGIE